MRVLVFTNMYPTLKHPSAGIFVQEQVESLREAGVEVDVLDFNGKGSAVNYLKAGLALRRMLNNKSYQLVHAHYGLSGAAALLQTRCPVVITYHGSDLLGEVSRKNTYTLSGKLKTLISRWAGFGAAERIVVANVLKPKLWPKKAVTIPMGVNLSLFQPIEMSEARKQLALPDKSFLVLFVANPKDPTKRFDVAQKAVDLLRSKGFDIELVALSNTSHELVPVYMNACNVLVLTSMHEASPCVIKEALACNLPVVSVEVGDVAERIDGVEGCYLCQRDPEEVAEKLCRVLESGKRTQSRSYVTDLSLQKVAQQVIAVYRKVLHIE
jgi:teichuronic acid biosynthesis glycosyltransferase TuaC